MIKESYTYQEIENLITIGKVEVLKQSKRCYKNNLKRKLIVLNNIKYLLCSECNTYYTLDKFGDVHKEGVIANKNRTCKRCRRKIEKNKYNTIINRHLRQRYTAIKNTSEKLDVDYLSYEEFLIFSETVKEPMFNLTLKEAFDLGKYNEFEIEHKTPISIGGTSLLDNLFLSHKSFNRLKGIMTVNEAIEFAKIIVKNEDLIRKSYENNLII